MIQNNPARALALCLLAAPLAAQPLPPVAEALQAASPDVPGNPPARVLMPAPVTSPAAPADQNAARQQWQQSNRDVAAFPRGHADLLRWEAGQPGAKPAQPATTAPPLTLQEALQRSLLTRPDLVQPIGVNVLEAASLHRSLVQHTLNLRTAWLAAVAARENRVHEQTQSMAADSAAELGQRMVQAGNWSAARLLREQLAQARQQAATLQAQAEVHRTTEALLRQMGVWRKDEVQAIGDRIPAALPALPPRPAAPADLEGTVLRARADLDNRRAEALRDARTLNDDSRRTWDTALADTLRQLPTEAMAPLRLSDPRPQRQHGLQATLVEEARLLRDAAGLRSQAREAWRELEHRHALAEHAQNVLLPLQTALEQETLLRYNGMLQSTWDLIEASRARLRAAADASAARHAFWQAQLNWDTLLAGGEPQPLAASSASPAPAGAAAAH